jgi:hypothetical protein
LPEEPETTGFISVPLAPGSYRFVFERAVIDEAGLPLSVLGLLIAGLLAIADRRPRGLRWLIGSISYTTRLAERLSEPRYGRVRAWALVGALSGLLGMGIALALWQPPMVVQELAVPAIRRVQFDFLESLYRAHVNVEYADLNRPCQRQKDRFVCPDREGNLSIDNYVASEPIDIKGYKMYRCIRARPMEQGTLSVIYPRVPAGDAIVGYYAIAHSGRLLNQWRPASFSISVGGGTVFSGTTEEDSHIYWFKVPVREPGWGRYKVSVAFSAKAIDVRQRHLCFYAQMVDFQ